MVAATVRYRSGKTNLHLLLTGGLMHKECIERLQHEGISQLLLPCHAHRAISLQIPPSHAFTSQPTLHSTTPHHTPHSPPTQHHTPHSPTPTHSDSPLKLLNQRVIGIELKYLLLTQIETAKTSGSRCHTLQKRSMATLHHYTHGTPAPSTHPQLLTQQPLPRCTVSGLTRSWSLPALRRPESA